MLSRKKIIKQIKRKMYFCIDFFFYALLTPIFVFINLFKPVKVALLSIDRIGHLGYDTEIYLRRKQLGIIDKNLFTIFVPIPFGAEVANTALFEIWKRYIYIIENKIIAKALYALYRFNSRYWVHIGVDSNEYYEFNNTNPIIEFTEEENILGYNILEKMGVGKEDWYVCIFARDNSYLKTLSHLASIDMSYQDYRDADIDSYVDATKYIIDNGGFVVRLGKVVAKQMNYKSQRFIDYACSEFRSDFMDIFLQKKAKFVVANTSGICEMAKIFDVPFCGVNIIPIDCPPAGKHNIYIPKKLKYKNGGGFMSLSKYLDLLDSKDLDGVDSLVYLRSEFYAKENLEIVDNDSIEILEIVAEMNDRIDNAFDQTSEDIERQNRYALIHKRSYQFSNVYSPIGRNFLRKNEWFLS